MKPTWHWEMCRTDPVPRKPEVPVRPKFRWRVHGQQHFDIDPPIHHPLYWEVMHRRRSSRVIVEAPVYRVAAVVRDVMRIIDKGCGDQAGRFRKAAISAGALHPLDALIVSSQKDECPLLYDDSSDSFLSLVVTNENSLATFRSKAIDTLPTAKGHWIVLTADVQRTSASYRQADSLVWRDAGAMLQLLAMTCFAKDLAFCPLGILGCEVINALHDDDEGPIAVGAAAVGNSDHT